MKEFLERLASKDPVPGGGGASALIAALSCALASMVANLTTGKKKYASYQDRIEEILVELEQKRQILLTDIDRDAEAFTPLAEAYALDKDYPGREVIMEKALLRAAQAPLEMIRDTASLIPFISELSEIGSKLAISDVAVSAAACSAALQGGIVNVYINTKLMKNREYAEKINHEAVMVVSQGTEDCTRIYKKILEGLQ